MQAQRHAHTLLVKYIIISIRGLSTLPAVHLRDGLVAWPSLVLFLRPLLSLKICTISCALLTADTVPTFDLVKRLYAPRGGTPELVQLLYQGDASNSRERPSPIGGPDQGNKRHRSTSL
jgi:hypothetical protein